MWPRDADERERTVAAGIDPDVATIVLQTEIPAIAELTWYFAMLLSFKDVNVEELPDNDLLDTGEIERRD